jgi:hypothetical protein
MADEQDAYVTLGEGTVMHVISDDGDRPPADQGQAPSTELVLWRGERPGGKDEPDVVELPPIGWAGGRKVTSRRRLVVIALIGGMLIGGATEYLIQRVTAVASSTVESPIGPAGTVSAPATPRGTNTTERS